MSRKQAIVALPFLLALSWTGVHAEEPATATVVEAELRVLVNAIQADRKAMVAVNLDLTDDEAAAFWPIYDRYHESISANGDRLAALITRYTDTFPGTSDDQAMGLVDDFLAIDVERAQVRRTYLPAFAKVLPGKKVALLYQIENKLDAVIRYDLAATIPVIPE
ncbi:MAG TPA: hypothetical protein ENO14_01245 [Chromatiales bacterium]|nr:hypothetical protein [Chromatiales bacterium]